MKSLLHRSIAKNQARGVDEPIASQYLAEKAPLERLRRERELRIRREFDCQILALQHKGTQQALAKARNRPVQTLAHKMEFEILRRILDSGLPLSKKLRARFDKSARKRDPRRSLYDTATSHDRAKDYNIWMRTKEPKHHLTSDQVSQINTQAQQFGPLISVIMSVDDSTPDYLEKSILSVLGQSFKNWQFCIADDASRDPEIRSILETYTARDPRIQVVFRGENDPAYSARNSALAMAIGDFVALLNPEDMLAEHCLAHTAQAIQTHPEAQLIYSDEDQLYDDQTRVEPHFKGDWNRDLFYSHNYINHFSVLDKKVADAIGGFRSDLEGAHDYDFLLRAVALIKDQNILHLSKVLYHLRTHNSSTAQTSTAKITNDAGRQALSEFLQKHEHPDILVQDGIAENFYHVIWPLPADEPKVSIIIPTRDHKDLLETAVNSILGKTDYQNYEIIIVDNGSVETETLVWFKTIQAQSSKVQVLTYNEPFNYSAINNFAVDQTDSDIIALVNNDVEVIGPSWLREMVSHAIRDDIGCVGAKLHYTNGQIQHGGVIIGIDGKVGHSHKHYGGTHHGQFGRLIATQNMSAVTGACLVLERSLYEEVKGLDARNLAVAFNDIDLCLNIQAAGYRNLWSPYATLFHHESISRGHENTPEKLERVRKEEVFMIDKWKPADNPDRYYSPNLTLDREDFSIDISS